MNSKAAIKDPYKILGVPRNVTKEELKKVYRTKMKEAHPDSNPGKDTEDLVREYNNAYDNLHKPEKRKAIDQLLRAEEERKRASTSSNFSSQSNTNQSNTSQSNTSQSNTNRSNTNQSNTSQSNTNRSNTSQSNTNRSNTSSMFNTDFFMFNGNSANWFVNTDWVFARQSKFGTMGKETIKIRPLTPYEIEIINEWKRKVDNTNFELTKMIITKLKEIDEMKRQLTKQYYDAKRKLDREEQEKTQETINKTNESVNNKARRNAERNEEQKRQNRFFGKKLTPEEMEAKEKERQQKKEQEELEIKKLKEESQKQAQKNREYLDTLLTTITTKKQALDQAMQEFKDAILKRVDENKRELEKRINSMKKEPPKTYEKSQSDEQELEKMMNETTEKKATSKSETQTKR